MLTPGAKRSINKLLGRFGYKITKALDDQESSIDLFDVLVKLRIAVNPNFFFVQIGANDGSDDDPIREYVLRYHWRGILIEPQPGAFQRLVENYKGETQLIFENVAIAQQDGRTQMYTLDDQADVFATFDRGLLERGRGRNSKIGTIEVETRSLESLLRKHGVEALDLLQIDAEGFDYQVVKMMAESKLRPTLVRYEHVLLSREDRDACAALLARLGYKLSQANIDVIAYREGDEGNPVGAA